jgi:hypothetical protein
MLNHRQAGFTAASVLALSIVIVPEGPAVVSDAYAKTQVTVTSRVPSWTRQAAEVVIRVQGLSEPVEAIPALILEAASAGSAEYWAPVQISKGVPLEANSADVLSAAAPIEIRIDPNALLWGRRIAAIWPQARLEDAVPVGKYRLYVNVEILEPKAPVRRVLRSYRSNTVEIEIR